MVERVLTGAMQQFCQLYCELRLAVRLGEPRQLDGSPIGQIGIAGGKQDRKVRAKVAAWRASSMPVMSGMA